MKRNIYKFLFLISFCALLIPSFVDAKEIINKIVIKNVVAPVVGEDSNTAENTSVTTDTEGITIGTVQWQTKNSSVFDEKYQEGTTYVLFIEYDVLDGYELAEEIELEANENYIDIDYGEKWVGLYYKTPGEGIKHTLSFNTNGGSIIEPQLVEDGDLAQTPTNPTREGYIFEGWYKDSNFNEEYDFYTKVEEDITLYAKWILEATIVDIETINVNGIELPLGNDAPSTNAYVNTAGLSQEVAQWQTVDGHTNIDKFEFGKQYVLYIGYSIDSGYKLSENVNVVANENPDKIEVYETGVLLYYTVKKNIEVPLDLKALKVGAKNISICWNKISDAKGYILYTSTNGKKWKKLTTTKKNIVLTYNNKKLKPGTTHYYKVVAYRTVKKKNVTILTSKVLKAMTVPSTSKLKISSTYNSIKLNIKKVTGASNYIIERSEDKKNYVKIAEPTKAGNYVDNSVLTGTKYYYRVKACNDNCGSYTKVISATPSLKKPTLKVTSGKKKVTIKIPTVSGADGYVIERSTKKNKGYTLIKLVDNTTTKTYEDIELLSKKTYYYRIRAYRIFDGKTIFSSYSKVVKVKVK